MEPRTSNMSERRGSGMRINNRNNYNDEFKVLEPYFTPYEAIASLIVAEGERLPQRLIEPMAGQGNIVYPVQASGRTIIARDIYDYGAGFPLLDYFAAPAVADVDGLITNPPFDRALEVLRKAIVEYAYVALLLRPNFFDENDRRTRTRGEWLEQHPPTRVWKPQPRYPMMHRWQWAGPRAQPNGTHFWGIWVRNAPREFPEILRWRDLDLSGFGGPVQTAEEPRQKLDNATSGSPARPRAKRQKPDMPITGDTPLPELLARASKYGTGFRPQGRGLCVTNATSLPPDLSQILRSRCAEISDHLGGTMFDQPPLDLLAQLGAELMIPQTINETRMALAEIAADALAYTPRELRDRLELVGLDIETAALPGMEQRPAVKLNRNGYPLAPRSQPKLKSDAGLDPHRSRIRLVQMYAGGQRCLVLDTDLMPLDTVREFLQCHTVVIHNACFELHHFAAAGIEIPHFECTMQAAGLLLGTRRRGLDDAASTYLGLDVPKDLQKSDWSAPYLSLAQLAYAAVDAILAFRTWLKLRLDLIEKNRGDAYLLQRDVIRPTTRMIMRGIFINREAHAQQDATWLAQHAEAEAAFNTSFIAVTGEPFPTEKGKDKAKRAYLEKVLPPELRETWPLTEKKGQLSLAAADLKRVSREVPAIQALLNVEATGKLLRVYGTELINKISKVTGRLHPNYNISATKTGRFSSSKPNVQQFPSKKKAPEFRQCIAAPPGWVLIAGDYHMMEVRAAAEVSNDPVMRADFARGVDLHTQTAAMMLGIAYDDVDEDTRNRAKAVNFSIIYGAGTNGIVKAAWANYGIELPWEEAEAARQAFLCRYGTYANWMGTHHALATHRGVIEIGKLGRCIEAAWEPKPATNGARQHRPEHNNNDDDDDYWVVDDETDTSFFGSNYGWAQELLKYTLCCNAPIQGACADVSMLALLKIDSALREARIDGGPILFVHDEIVIEVPEKDAEQAEKILKACMEAAFIETFPEAPRNRLVSTKIGTNWAEAKP
jgi:DNA polymerase-1